MTENELYHYGVKGMKWGKRKAQRIDTQLRRTETLRKNNKNTYDTMRSESKEKYSGNSKKLKKSLAKDKTLYDTTETVNNYRIAKLKAKKDKNYKQSTEYKKAKQAYSKQYTQQVLYGQWGHQRIETLKNMGSSSAAAKGRVAAESVLAGVALTAGMVGFYKLTGN